MTQIPLVIRQRRKECLREILSSSNSSPERSADTEVVEVVEMPENLESKVDLILARLETMDNQRKL